MNKRLVSKIQMPEFPSGSLPFDIKDIPGDRQVIMTRESDGERVEVNVRFPGNHVNINLISDDEDEDKDSSSSSSVYGPCPFSVKIMNDNKKTWMEMSCLANMDSFRIKSIDFKGSPTVKDSTLKFCEDDGDDLEEYWKKDYLGVRGIDESLSRFVMKYMVKKLKHERLLFLQRFRMFVKK